MGESLIAKRYAKALFLLNPDLSAAKKVLVTLSVIKELFDEKKIGKVLMSPAMPNDLKAEILKYAVDKAGGGSEIMHFIQTVLEAGRIAIFPSIYKAFKAMIDEREGVLQATVTTAVPLEQEDLEEIRQTLEKASRHKIQLERKTDKAILGGLVVKIGNSLLDLSLRKKLDSVAQNAMHQGV